MKILMLKKYSDQRRVIEQVKLILIHYEKLRKNKQKQLKIKRKNKWKQLESIENNYLNLMRFLKKKVYHLIKYTKKQVYQLISKKKFFISLLWKELKKMEKLHNSVNLKDFNDFIDRKTLFDDVKFKTWRCRKEIKCNLRQN